MYYSAVCPSPLGMLTLGSDGEHLIGLWLEGQKYFGGAVREVLEERDGLPVFDALARYLLEKSRALELPLCPIGTALLPNTPARRNQAILPGRWRRRWEGPPCPARQWAARWAITPSPSSFHATGSWARLSKYAGIAAAQLLEPMGSPPVRPQEGHGALSHGSLTLSADAGRPQPPISSPGLGGLPGCRRTGAGIEQTSRS